MSTINRNCIRHQPKANYQASAKGTQPSGAGDETRTRNLLFTSPTRAMQSRAPGGFLPLSEALSVLSTCSSVHPVVNPRVKLREPKEVMSKIN